MHALTLLSFYIAVMLAPLALAWADGKPPRSIGDELASGAGLVAFSIILMEFVLSGRFKVISGRIGMDVTMRVHQLMARTAAVLVIVHPFLYRAPFDRQRPWDTARQMTLTADFDALATGALAWVLLPALILFAVGRDSLDIKYETWRLMHGLMAALIAGLSLHHALYAGRYSGEPLMSGLWIMMVALALASLLYVYLIKPLGQAFRPWSVNAIEPEALKIWRVTLSPRGHGGLKYRAGQFVWLNIGHSAFSLAENPFSISSAPADGRDLTFLIKELGDFTGSLATIPAGTKAYVDGPHGNLTLHGRRATGIALIAGGVGVAPLLAILRQLQHDGDDRPTILLYGNRVAEQIVHGEELDRLSETHGTEVVHILSEPPDGWSGPVGMVDAALVRQQFNRPDAATWLYVLCGPPAMMQVVEDTLIDMGVPSGQVISERFNYD